MIYNYKGIARHISAYYHQWHVPLLFAKCQEVSDSLCYIVVVFHDLIDCFGNI